MIPLRTHFPRVPAFHPLTPVRLFPCCAVPCCCLLQHFSVCGEITEIIHSRSLRSVKRRDFAFITYTETHCVDAAIKAFNGSRIRGNTVTVQVARPVEYTRGAPGSGGGFSRRCVGPRVFLSQAVVCFIDVMMDGLMLWVAVMTIVAVRGTGTTTVAIRGETGMTGTIVVAAAVAVTAIVTVETSAIAIGESVVACTQCGAGVQLMGSLGYVAGEVTATVAVTGVIVTGVTVTGTGTAVIVTVTTIATTTAATRVTITRAAVAIGLRTTRTMAVRPSATVAPRTTHHTRPQRTAIPRMTTGLIAGMLHRRQVSQAVSTVATRHRRRLHTRMTTGRMHGTLARRLMTVTVRLLRATTIVAHPLPL